MDPEIFNEEGSSQHKYFYSKPEQIAKSMKKVLEKYQLNTFDVWSVLILYFYAKFSQWEYTSFGVIKYIFCLQNGS